VRGNGDRLRPGSARRTARRFVVWAERRWRSGAPKAAGGGAIALLAVALLAGCGLGAGPAPSGVQLLVTRDFGGQTVRSWSAPQVHGQETVMSLLMRNANVSTRFGGGFVQSIGGLSGGHKAGQPIDWFYYVNGVQAPKGAADTNVNPGDRIWWDRHDWSQAESVPAVVGSFPQPFQSGVDGKRWPVRIECAALSSAPCRSVTARLQALGVLAARAAVAPAQEPETLRVMVGPWSALSIAPEAAPIARGPGASGVYVRFSANGQSLTLLDERGDAVRTLTNGGGLVAATRYAEEAPVWVVTGTDDAGVEAAARTFDADDLRDHFALAVAPGGATLPVPAAG